MIPWALGWMSNHFKRAFSTLINRTFQPTANKVVNSFVIPILLGDGIVRIPSPFNGRADTGSLFFDATLPKSPSYDDELMRLFITGAAYFSNKGLTYDLPSKFMGF